MKRIETLKCNHPRLFWVSWDAILLWMVTVTINYASGYTLIDQFVVGCLGILTIANEYVLHVQFTRLARGRELCLFPPSRPFKTDRI